MAPGIPDGAGRVRYRADAGARKAQARALASANGKGGNGTAMNSHVRAAVIGGGAVGCGVLHHLTRLGPERFRLTASYAAQGFHMRWFEAHLPAGDEVVGFVTSGGHAHWSGKSIALGYVPVELMEDSGAEFTVEILGERRAATLLREPILDPRGERMRG